MKTKNHLRQLAAAAFLVALSIVCGKYLAVPVGTVMRFSFENLPLILAGMLFGPAIGALTAVAADLLGCLFRGYAINPFITVASMSVGLVSGMVAWIFGNQKKWYFKVIFSVFLAHTVGNVIIKTFALHSMMGTPLSVLFAERIVTYIMTASVECVIIILLLQNKAIKKRLVQNKKLMRHLPR